MLTVVVGGGVVVVVVVVLVVGVDVVVIGSGVSVSSLGFLSSSPGPAAGNLTGLWSLGNVRRGKDLMSGFLVRKLVWYRCWWWAGG